MNKASQFKDILKFGDEICISAKEHYFWSTGAISNNINAVKGTENIPPDPSIIQGCVFRVLPVGQHNAKKELEEYMAKEEVLPKVEYRKNLKDLKDLLLKEELYNEQTSKKMFGKCVSYGQTIELQRESSLHILSYVFFFYAPIFIHMFRCIK